MRRQGRMAKVALWLVVWAVFTVVMRYATGFAGTYKGWSTTAVTSALVVASWYLVPWWRSRRERKTTAQ